MRLFSTFLLLVLPLLTVAQPGTDVQYTIAFPNAAHHEARVTIVLPQQRPMPQIRIEMARSSPGRYALHEFAKNVYDVTAVADNGQPLKIRRTDPYSWEVDGLNGRPVRFSYTVFADRADGTYAAIDPERAHLNLPAVLAYAPAFADHTQWLHLEQLPDTAWRVATQLKPEPNGWYSAPNLQYLMDSPMLIGKLTRRQWTQDGQQFEIALLHRGSAPEADSLAARTQRLTRAEARIWGTLPRFDFGHYTFLADYLPTAVGDGMEHRNSTMVPLPKPLKGGDIDHLGTISHEFFHSWNVERLRPADLEPFDFQRANMSRYLWLAEGFTLYYGDLVTRRAGLLTDDEYLKGDATRLVQQSLLPGAGRFSPIEMSQQAPFVDAARSIDPTNRLNTYVSYYTLGGATALALDLALRARDHSLDAVMRRLWETNGQFQSPTLAPQKPYTLPDIQRAIAEVAGDSAFAGQFIRRHVTGHEAHDWAALLAPAGLTIQPLHPDQRWLGVAGFTFGPTGATLADATVLGSPLHTAGFDRGDRIERMDGRKIRSQKDLTKALTSHALGETVLLDVSQRGLPTRSISLTLTADPTVQVVRRETLKGQTVTEGQLAFRKNWLTGR
jgi:predicted metalloprotease with PDZ domain